MGNHNTSTKNCIRPIINKQYSLHVDFEWATAGSMCEAERKLADTLRRLIQLCRTYEVEHRMDSEQLKRTVEKEWEEWKIEAGHEAEQLESDWRVFHNEVQQRLGPPTDHSKSNTLQPPTAHPTDGSMKASSRS